LDPEIPIDSGVHSISTGAIEEEADPRYSICPMPIGADWDKLGSNLDPYCSV